MTNRYYVAYGSNLNLKQMKHRCPQAHVVGTAEISNYELLFKGEKNSAYLTIEPKSGTYVPVGVWEVTPEDEASLDTYEGYPDFYYKKDIELLVKEIDGTQVTLSAFVYIMHEENSLGNPTDRYMNTCLEGYKDFKFDDKFLIEAHKKSERSC